MRAATTLRTAVQQQQPIASVRPRIVRSAGIDPFGHQGQQKQSNLAPSNYGQNRGAEQVFAFQHQQGHLADPGQDLKDARIQLKQVLFDEYVESGGQLGIVLEWAEQCRQRGVCPSPLVDLIDRVANSTGGKERRHLVPSLYAALLRSPEARLYASRAELLLPAILQAFQSSNPLPKLEQICTQIRRSLSQYNSPDRIETLRRNLDHYFHQYVYHNHQALDNDQIVALATTLRKSCVFPYPLATAVDALIRASGREGSKERVLTVHTLFLGTEEERKGFADRPHIFFPWMLQQFRSTESENFERTVHQLVMMCTERPGDVPRTMVEHLFKTLPLVFDRACMRREFRAADHIWKFSGTDPLTRDRRANHTRFSHASLLVFAIHLWRQGRFNEAKLVRNRLRESTLYNLNAKRERGAEKHEGPETPYHKYMRRLNGLNACYRQIVKNTPLSDATRERCHQIWVHSVHAFISETGVSIHGSILQLLRAVYEDGQDRQAQLEHVNAVLNCLPQMDRNVQLRRDFLNELQGLEAENDRKLEETAGKGEQKAEI